MKELRLGSLSQKQTEPKQNREQATLSYEEQPYV